MSNRRERAQPREMRLVALLVALCLAVVGCSAEAVAVPADDAAAVVGPADAAAPDVAEGADARSNAPGTNCDGNSRLDDCQFLNPDASDAIRIWGFDVGCTGVPTKYGYPRAGGGADGRLGCVTSGNAVCCADPWTR